MSYKSLIHFEFIFVNSVRVCSNFIDLHVVSNFPSTSYWGDYFFHYITIPPLLKVNWLQACGFISGLSILSHWSMCLFFVCQYHTVLITVALLCSLKSGRIILPAFLFFLRIVLAILDLLWSHRNFRIICWKSHG